MSALRLALAAGLAALAVAPQVVLAGESPFVGTWKLNQEKSQLTGDTMHFAAKRAGKVRVTAGGQSYTFKADGKDYEGPTRMKVAWTRVDDRTWRAVWKLKKKPVYTETLEIAPDGKSLKDSVQGTRADGTPFDDSSVYERTAGDGTWCSHMGAPCSSSCLARERDRFRTPPVRETDSIDRGSRSSSKTTA